ncbi:GDYXXLXY domain-containing protein [Ottowia thiooxydans]|uniref:Membrane-anchored protein n=1 Tax=Ottowia thiooxydans TaxID=219182 RepID=A0ABV2QFG0_9BURK
MSTDRPWIEQAQARGWLPENWGVGPGDAEPSPLLIALVLLGALACSVPLLIFLGFGLGNVLSETAAGYVVGALSMGAAMLCLRRTRHIFAICLAIVWWGLGATIMLWRWMDDTDGGAGAMLAAGVFLVVSLLGSAALTRALWVNRLIGFVLVPALFAVLLLSLQTVGAHDEWWVTWWPLGLMCLTVIWAWWSWREEKFLGQPDAGRLAALADGFAIGILANALFLSVFPALFLGFVGNVWGDGSTTWIDGVSRSVAVIITLASGFALVRRWRSGRPHMGSAVQHSDTLLALSFVVMAAASWFSPALGMVALVAAVAAATSRWRLVIAAAVVALALLSNFYYSLAWPLVTKALGLAVMGGALALGVFVLQWGPRSRKHSKEATAPRSKRQLGWILVGGVLALGLANADVWRKEQVIAHGQRILVPLAPVDPRSLMQGDYMQLRFSIPPKMLETLNESASYRLSKHAVVIARLNTRAEAELVRLDGSGETLAEGEIRLPLRQLKGDWVLVTDAYFFAEGQGARFEQARFGEFRVLSDGRALLVGLADQEGRGIASWEPTPKN